MNLFSDNFIFVCCFFLMFVVIPIRINNEKKLEDFNEYLKKFNKSYSNREDYTNHLNAYQISLDVIEKLNTFRTYNSSAKYGLTPYSDLTKNEFLNNHLLLKLPKRKRQQYMFKNYEKYKFPRSTLRIPLKVDWREYGVISDVNNQKFCGACWAFTVIENVEAMYALKTGNLSRFSVQEMIDCAKYNDGCNGGDMCLLLHWLKNGQIPIQKTTDYPLTLVTEKCKLNRTIGGVRILNYICQDLQHDENMILSLLANHGPVIAAINALTWQNYLGGVIQFHCSDSPFLLNHAVQIVGYDLTGEIPYYIVRNSWGVDFGENGYLYVSIGNNTCGIANEVIALSIL